MAGWCVDRDIPGHLSRQARHLTWTLGERPESFRFLIHDRDQKFTDSSDDVFRSIGIEIVRTPFRAPQSNGVAERFVRTVRSECLDWLLILTRGHLERLLSLGRINAWQAADGYRVRSNR